MCKSLQKRLPHARRGEFYIMDKIIITISRQFGSGGREFGRRLSDELGIAYYDKEIISAIAARTELSEEYVHRIVEHKPYVPLPITTGVTFHATDHVMEHTFAVYNEQRKIIREMAEKSDCVIVGRCSDFILKDMHPLRVFVYADMKSRAERCRRKAPEHENLSDKALIRHINRTDKARARYYEMYTGHKWGNILSFDVCVNTSHIPVKDAARELGKAIKNMREK